MPPPALTVLVSWAKEEVDKRMSGRSILAAKTPDLVTVVDELAKSGVIRDSNRSGTARGDLAPAPAPQGAGQTDRTRPSRAAGSSLPQAQHEFSRCLRAWGQQTDRSVAPL